MENKVQLNPVESLAFAQEKAYWDGYAAGVAATTEHAKQMMVRRTIESRKVTTPPVPPTVQEQTEV